MSTKFLSDNEQTKLLSDKFIILTKTAGQDSKISAADLIGYLKQTMLRDYLKSKLGETYINTNNKYRDQDKFKDGYLEYILLNGQTIKKADYPDLFAALNITAETYKLEDYGQQGGCTLRHVAQGSGRALNSYEADELKSHLHDNTHEHKQTPHTHPDDHVHDMSHQHTYQTANNKDGDPNGGWDGGGDKHYWRYGNANATTWDGRNTTGGRNAPNTGASLSNIEKYQGSTSNTGGNETRMKNVAVQCYIVARVII